MNQSAKGFTLIELMIVIAIVGILAAVIMPMVFPETKAVKQKRETMCVGGYTFSTVGARSQIIDHNGKGIPCQ